MGSMYNVFNNHILSTLPSFLKWSYRMISDPVDEHVFHYHLQSIVNMADEH